MRISDWSSDVCSSDLSPRSLRLRAELPKVMRLSPKAMTILGGVSCLAISAALWWGLRATPPEATQNLYETANPTRSERITGGPVDYSKISKPGEPRLDGVGKAKPSASQNGEFLPGPPMDSDRNSGV